MDELRSGDALKKLRRGAVARDVELRLTPLRPMLDDRGVTPELRCTVRRPTEERANGWRDRLDGVRSGVLTVLRPTADRPIDDRGMVLRPTLVRPVLLRPTLLLPMLVRPMLVRPILLLPTFVRPTLLRPTEVRPMDERERCPLRG